MVEKILEQLRQKMTKTLDYFGSEMTQIHSGRASVGLVENLQVSCYETTMPLVQLATITLEGERNLLVQPWDKTIIPNIEKAINESNLGISVVNDGSALRISFPPLDEERREKLIRLASEKAEEARIALRNERREVLEKLEALKKEGQVSEDEFYKAKEELDRIIQDYYQKIEEILANKEKELKTI